MYYNLVGPLKRRVILELKDSFSNHPVYNKIVPFIQNRFSFEERPQFGIVIKGSSTNKVQLAADNYVGTVQSHVMLAYVGQPEYPLEWVREDSRVVTKNGGMPTPPGVYLMEILTAPTVNGEDGFFVIDPMYTVIDRPLIVTRAGMTVDAQLENLPLQNTLRLYANNSFFLKEGLDYTVDYDTGRVTFITILPANTQVSADYRWAGESIGPVAFQWNQANWTTLPGVVLAFGKRSAPKQKVAVVVYQDRIDAAEAYGGKFEVSFDFDVIARDPMQMEEIADLTTMYLLADKKSQLEFEGIEILDVSMGSEAEEIADETGENFFYQASMSLQLRADWEVHVPLPLVISKINSGGITPVASDVLFRTHPILQRRDDDYERIG